MKLTNVSAPDTGDQGVRVDDLGDGYICLTVINLCFKGVSADRIDRHEGDNGSAIFILTPI